MKTLFPIQVKAVEFLAAGLERIGGVLNASGTGTGKTLVAIETCRKLGLPMGVVCPKAVAPAWQRECEEAGIEPVFIQTVESMRTGNRRDLLARRTITRVVHGKEQKAHYWDWKIPKDTVVVMDECHKLKGQRSLNGKLSAKLIAQGYRTLNLSATAADSPLDMRYLGYSLRLHNLHSPRVVKGQVVMPDWHGWLRQMGCRKDMWGQWVLGKTTLERVAVLRELMGQDRFFRSGRADMPEAFRDSQVIVDHLDFGSELQRAYRLPGLTGDMVTRFVETGKLPGGSHFAAELLYRRILAEQTKVPYIVDEIQRLLDEGHSVPVFVNFRETIKLLEHHLTNQLGAGSYVVVQGGQGDEERQTAIDRFQSGETRVILLNTAAGGTGVSLHDTVGDRPRVSLISPSWSRVEFTQVLGRTSRAGMKSEAVQRILVGAGSVEERVMAVLTKKDAMATALLGE